MYANLLHASRWNQTRTRIVAWAMLLVAAGVCSAQRPTGNSVDFQVEGPSQRLEMVVNSSRILTLEEEIPRVLVNNQEILRVVPLAKSKIQVSALQPGVTQINLWGKSGNVHTIDVVVFADARQLELVLASEFPNAAIRVRPLASSVVLTGYVDRPEVVTRAVRIAEDYYPSVINNIAVGGVQQVALHVRVMEVSRTKLRQIGTDWGLITGNDFVVQSAAGLVAAAASGATGVAGTGNDTLRFGIVDSGNQFFGFIDFLRQNDLLKILAEPTLTTVSGRPASFNEGGEFPIIIPQSLGVNAVEFKEFGTRVDFVPIVLGNGNIRLEVRPEVSEIDNARAVNVNGVNIPGLRTRWVDTAVEMRAGQTLALAGLIQSRVESSSRGFPFLSELPWTGNLFRRNTENFNEIELLVLVRPELVSALEPHQVPAFGPGEFTTMPSDSEFYGRGYLEVPKCCPDTRCPGPQRSMGPQGSIYDGTVPVNPQPMPMMQPEMPADAAPAGAGVMQPGMSYSPQPVGPSAVPAEGSGSQMFGPSGYDNLEF